MLRSGQVGLVAGLGLAGQPLVQGGHCVREPTACQRELSDERSLRCRCFVERAFEVGSGFVYQFDALTVDLSNRSSPLGSCPWIGNLPTLISTPSSFDHHVYEGLGGRVVFRSGAPGGELRALPVNAITLRDPALLLWLGLGCAGSRLRVRNCAIKPAGQVPTRLVSAASENNSESRPAGFADAP